MLYPDRINIHAAANIAANGSLSGKSYNVASSVKIDEPNPAYLVTLGSPIAPEDMLVTLGVQVVDGSSGTNALIAQWAPVDDSHILIFVYDASTSTFVENTVCFKIERIGIG